jgi:hypothetical protein
LAPSGDGFTSMFPVAPALTTQSTVTAKGNAPTSTWTCIASSDLVYIVALVQYPTGSLAGVAPTAVYGPAVTGMANSSAGLSVSAQTDVTINGHAARTFTLTGPTADIQGELILVGDDLYMAYATYAPTVTDMSGVNAFLADFALTN